MTSKTYRFGLFSKPTIKEFKEMMERYDNIVFIFDTLGLEKVSISFIDVNTVDEIGIAFDNFCRENGDLKIKSYYVADGAIFVNI